MIHKLRPAQRCDAVRFLRPAIIVALAFGVVATSASASPGATERVSVDNAGVQGNEFSFFGDMSGDGRFVAFYSAASNLVAGDTNGTFDVFVRDRQTGTTERVSISTAGDAEGGTDPAISGDGRFVAFESGSDNLVADDTNSVPDVFVHDRQAGTTERVSISTEGEEGDGASFFPDISGDGRFVVFQSSTSDLVPDDTNGVDDILVHDRQTGITESVSVDSSGSRADSHSQVPSINGDGSTVAFTSFATNLVADDTNLMPDVFIHDRQAGVTERVSVSTEGAEGDLPSVNAAISADGSVVVYISDSNLVPEDTNGRGDVLVRDVQAGTTKRVSVDSAGSQSNDTSKWPAVSVDGRFVAFMSNASNLVPGDTNGVFDIFVHDTESGLTERVSVSSARNQGNRYSGDTENQPAISADGRYVAFDSRATNLVAGDTNGYTDVFVHDRSAPTLTPTSTPGELPETGGPSRSGAGEVRLAFTAALLAVGGVLIVLGWCARRRWMG
jgi:hypothetical protein